jgi:hypothetical protein
MDSAANLHFRAVQVDLCPVGLLPLCMHACRRCTTENTFGIGTTIASGLNGGPQLVKPVGGTVGEVSRGLTVRRVTHDPLVEKVRPSVDGRTRVGAWSRKSIANDEVRFAHGNVGVECVATRINDNDDCSNRSQLQARISHFCSGTVRNHAGTFHTAIRFCPE